MPRMNGKQTVDNVAQRRRHNGVNCPEVLSGAPSSLEAVRHPHSPQYFHVVVYLELMVKAEHVRSPNMYTEISTVICRAYQSARTSKCILCD